MAYRCPLCLKELTDRDRLIRYCNLCNNAGTEIKGNDESIRNSLKCPQRKCHSHGKVVEGVYFSHVGCEKLNPFWNDQTLAKPDNLLIDGVKITVPFNEGNSVFKHWQVSLLNKSLSLGRSEMWFPAMLLRATTETDGTGKRFGQIVGLVGTREAGKTILALQTLDDEGYFLPDSNQKFEIEDYIYSQRREGTAIQPIFELLRLRSLMRANQEFPQPSPTLRESKNLYTVFFSPTQKALQKKNNHKPKIISELSEKYEKVDDLFSRSWGTLKWAFGSEDNAQTQAKPFWFTLAIYDVAGEEYSNETELIKDLSQKVDKMALIIDATDFINTGSDEKGILADNLDGLKYLKNLGKPFCVVLTKMDLFIRQFENYVSNAPFNEELLVAFDKKLLFEGEQKIIKTLLRQWEKIIKIKESNSGDLINLKKLLNEILALSESTPIFAVSTENLPSDKNESIKIQPVSYGIDTLVCWCLDIEKDDFIESK